LEFEVATACCRSFLAAAAALLAAPIPPIALVVASWSACCFASFARCFAA